MEYVNFEDVVIHREFKQNTLLDKFIESDPRVKKVVRDYLSGLCNPLQLSTSLELYWQQFKGDRE